VSQPYIDGGPLLPSLESLPPISLDSLGAGQVLSSGEAILLTDPSRDSIPPLVQTEFHPYLEHYGVHSLLIVPMRSQGRSVGTITLAKGRSSRAYSAEDQAMLQNLADRSALTLANARLYAENLNQAEQLRVANVELEQRVAERTAELELVNERLHRIAIEDTLTGLANRRRFNEVMEEETRRARRTGGIFSLLMCDVDFFKRFNDEYGHQGGDDCLRIVGEVMRNVFKRAGELPARYGGEEFAVVLPGVAREQAELVAEKLRQSIAERNVPHARSDVAPFVTLSIGLVSAPVGPDTDPDWFIAKADEALYHSKERGRNCVTCA
jgi:diguanylate cyclase (GGDEF)-like protein